MTKNDPGKYDCYAKAAPDEPLFTLRAKDPTAASFVRAWRHINAGNLLGAVHEMNLALEAFKESGREPLPFDGEKSMEAAACAASMEDWLFYREPNEKLHPS